MTDLGTLGGDNDAQSVAWAINEHGVVVGRSDVDELETDGGPRAQPTASPGSEDE